MPISARAHARPRVLLLAIALAAAVAAAIPATPAITSAGTIQVDLSLKYPGDQPVYGGSLTATASVSPVFPEGADAPPSGNPTPNPITVENKQTGVSRWTLSNPAPRESTLSGYASAVSVNAGDSVQLFLSDDAGSGYATINVLRAGWYGGTGARLVESISTVPVTSQPACTTDPTTHMVSCANWSSTYTLQTSTSWTTGDYLLRVTDARGYQTYIPLTVRDDSAASTILVINSVNTWQAYNYWGGYSLYTQYNPDTAQFLSGRSFAVSFDRPYFGWGANQFLKYEYQDVRWLERRGYDVSYATDVDVDQHPDMLLNHRAVIVLGHSEYWTDGMRQAFENARDQGVSIAFLGGNDVYYHARYQSAASGSDRVLICYKSYFLDPNSATGGEISGRWRDAPTSDPENALLGPMWSGSGTGNQPFVVGDSSGWEYAGAGATDGEISPTLPVNGEFDTLTDNGRTPPGTVDLGSSLAIPVDSTDDQSRAVQAASQCPVSFPTLPATISTQVRTDSAFSLTLVLQSVAGTVFLLAYNNSAYGPPVDHNLYTVSVKQQAPMDGAWHTLSVSPAADLARLGGPLGSTVIGLWMYGRVDATPVTLSATGIDGQGLSTAAGTTCGWSSHCPVVAATFCGTPDNLGVIEDEVTAETDDSVGTYDSFSPLPARADTTIYQDPSGALVFDSGFYGWGAGLTTGYSSSQSWIVLDQLLANVLNRMASTPISSGEVWFSVDGGPPTGIPMWDGQPGSVALHLPAGDHTIAASYTPPDGYGEGYENAGAQETVTVGKATLTVTAGNGSMVYGSEPPDIGATYSGFVAGDDLSAVSGSPACSTTASPASHVDGSYSTDCTTGTLTAANYDFQFQPGIMEVTPAPLTVSAGGAMVYGSGAPQAMPVYAGFENGDTAAELSGSPACTTDATATSPVGSYAASCAAGTVSSPHGDYNFSFTGGQFTVTPAPLTITASSQSTVYGSRPQAVTPSYAGLVNGDDGPATSPRCSTPVTASSPVATYQSQCAGAADPNYTISYVPGVVTVTPRPLTITANNLTVPYGSPIGTVGWSATGFANGDGAGSLTTPPVCTSTAEQGSAVGTYGNECAGAASPNYRISYVAGVTRIRPVGLLISGGDQTTVYGAAIPVLAWSAQGFVAGDTVSSLTSQPACTTTATRGSHTGTYATECSGAADGNYRIAYSPGSLTVLPASLLIRPRPAAAVFGHGSPSLTWKANFVAGDGRLSLTDPPVCFTTARLSTRGTVVSPAGVYSILCRGAASPDYAISYQAGSYVVAREPTAMKYEGAARTKAGTTTRLVALLRRDTGAPVAGRLLSFVVRKGQWTGRCQARTGSHGKAQCSLTIGGTAGQGQIAITFAGDKAGPECDFAPATSKAEIVIRRR